MRTWIVSNLIRQVASLRAFVECVRDCFDCNNPDGLLEGDPRAYPHDEVTDCWRCYAESILAEVDRGKRKKFRKAGAQAGKRRAA